MSMSDCEKCWSTPCCCGWQYRNYSEFDLAEYIANITEYRSKEDAKKIILRALEIVSMRLSVCPNCNKKTLWVHDEKLHTNKCMHCGFDRPNN